MARLDGESQTPHVQIQLSYPSSNAYPDPRAVALTVTDGPSGINLLSVDLTPTQFRNLLSSACLSEVPAWVLPERLYHRVGKRIVTSVRKEFSLTDGESAARVYADSLKDQHDTVECRRSNAGWVILAQDYVPS